ncbi:hypothetical protein FACS189465_1300 [Clostridia bacterium]|nr:hypothetical protein FACS189465_1300 [Clostridia bacterium]
MHNNSSVTTLISLKYFQRKRRISELVVRLGDKLFELDDELLELELGDDDELDELLEFELDDDELLELELDDGRLVFEANR